MSASGTAPNRPPDVATPHECHSCGSRFGSPCSLRHHRSARHSTCSFISNSKEYLVAPDKNGYTCPLCSQPYRNRDGLQRHLRKQHGVTFSNGAVSCAANPSATSLLAVEGSHTPPGNARSQGAVFDQTLTLLYDEQASSNNVGWISSEQLLETQGLSGAVHTPDGQKEFAEGGAVEGDDEEGRGHPGVTLVPGRSYLETSLTLDDLGLWLHTGLQVLICRRCKTALSSKMVAGHMKKQHAMAIPEARKRELENLCELNRVYEHPLKVHLPKAGGPPVEGIAPPVAGLSCAADGDCRYSIQDRQAMIRHGREKHEGGTLATTKCRASKVQALFLGVGHVYFEVDPELTTSSDIDARNYLWAVFLQEADHDEVVAADGSRDRPPLLNVTHWDEFMPEIRENIDQRRAARTLKGKHTLDEHEGIFDVLQRTVVAHHKTTRRELEHSANPFLLRKVLLNGPDFPTERSKRYFTVLSEDDNNYTRLFVQMVRAMVRARQGHSCILTFQYTGCQAVQLDSLIECLKGAAQRPEVFHPMMVEQAYQAFCWSLVYSPGPETQSRWADPIERFIWLMALGDDGTFIQASDLTPVLAKLKYFCRITTLHEALVFKNGEKPSEGTIERVGHHHSLALRLDRLSTFNMISELQQFVTALALSQTKDPKVFVDPDFQWIKIKTDTLYLDALREGIRELIRWIKGSFILLSGDTAWPVQSQASHIEDDVENSKRGYCFLEESPYREARHSFFLAAVERCRLGAFVRPREWAWDMAAVRSFLDRADDLWGHVIHLLYVGLHLSTRVTQFLQYQFRNADRPRNLVFQGAEGISITRYSKSTNAKWADACIPAFLSAPLREILLVLLGSGFREAQAILAELAYGREARWLYRTYLCVERGERIAPDSFYEVLRKRNEKFFGCAWGASDFRQAMITLGREFISPNEAFPCADEVLAEAADHTTEIDATHYANVHGAFPRLSNNILCQQRWLSEEWSSLLGLGPHDPPDPIRIIQKNFKARPTTDKTGLSAELTEAISTAVADAVMRRFESMGLTADILKKAAELAQPLSRALLHPPPTLAAQAIAITDLSMDKEQEQAVPEERTKLPPPLSLDNPFQLETWKCNKAGQVTPGSTNRMERGPSKAAHPFETIPLQLSCTRSFLSTPVPESEPEALDLASKRGREGVQDLDTLQEPARPLKRLRLPRASGTQDKSEWLQSSRYPDVVHRESSEPDSTDDFTASHPHISRVDSMEQALGEGAPSDSDAGEDTDTDGGCDNVEMDTGRPGSRDISLTSTPSQEPLYTSNVLNTHPESDITLCSNIRGAMEHITGISGTSEKSRAQMLGILLVLQAQTDAMITIRTGGGKSMLWMVPPLLKEDVRFLVICPYRILLEEQCRKAQDANIRAFNYTHSKHIPSEVQILFLQVEHVGSQGLDAFLARTDRPRFTHLFVDECHDILTCPKDRQIAWRKFTEWATAMNIPIFLLSATIPPKLQKKLLKKYSMRIRDTAIVRSPTNRPEIGLHTIKIVSLSPDYSLFQLVDGLERRLAEKDRMLVYTFSRPQAERLANSWNCAVYHSTLPLQGNTKEYNLGRWDRGETKVMLCTSAFGLGVDRPNVRFVVIYEPALDLLTTSQMLGRAGRDGTPSHAFFVTRDPAASSEKTSRDDQLPKELTEIMHKKLCKVYQFMRHLDGEHFPQTCVEIPGQLPCDICEPKNSMHQFAMQAVQNPHRPNHKLRTYDLAEPSLGDHQGYAHPDPQCTQSSSFPIFAEQTNNLKKLPVTHALDSIFNQKNGNESTICKVTKVLSQQDPLALKALSQVQGGPSRSASLPNMSGPGLRAAGSLSAKGARLGRTKDLDRYMPVLKGKCAYHFITKAEIVADDFPDCPYFTDSSGDYNVFKREFVFERFTYCFSCGMPQDRNRNGEAPSCHAGIPYGRGCTFGSFIFRAVFCIWQNPQLRERMRLGLGLTDSLSSLGAFVDWAKKEQREEGKYHNCLEAFLWFCDMLEKRNPQLFLPL
ncbi:hypothetical protein HD554DRAFT_2041944 [Boletus coccyginus]|nr:hypothetical protein HD554DRAFT_2041944 [Boletus coccyginus]